jgi:predicted transcriptional regulator
VADRFHLTKNIREKLKDLLDRKRTCLPFVEENTVQSASAKLADAPEQGSLGEAVMREHEQSRSPVNLSALPQLDEGGSSRPLTVPEWRRKVSREKRYALYEEVRTLRKQGLSHYAIADTLGISRPTVRRFLAAEQFPERPAGPKRQRQSIVASPYVRQLLVEAANAAARTKNTYLSAHYHRIAARQGRKRALIAVGHTILVIIYHLLSRQKSYEELGSNYFEKRDQQNIEKRLMRRLEKLATRSNFTRRRKLLE